MAKGERGRGRSDEAHRRNAERKDVLRPGEAVTHTDANGVQRIVVVSRDYVAAYPEGYGEENAELIARSEVSRPGDVAEDGE